MKIGIMFESNREADQVLHISLINETWTNHNLQSLWSHHFTFSQQRRLMMDRFTDNDLMEVKHLIQKTRTWCIYTGIPHKYVIDHDEIALWKKLLKMTECVIGYGK